MSSAELRNWLRTMDLLGSAKTSAAVLPPFGVELVHSEGTRSRSFADHLWDPGRADLDLLAFRRVRGLWTDRGTIFEAAVEDLVDEFAEEYEARVEAARFGVGADVPFEGLGRV